jgi:hypothetical protein
MTLTIPTPSLDNQAINEPGSGVHFKPTGELSGVKFSNATDRAGISKIARARQI